MKFRRLAAILCVLLMMLSVVSLASAEDNAKYFGYESNFYTLTKGKTVSFLLLSNSHTLYTSDGNSYADVIYDCEGPVSATVNSGKNWITVTNTMNSFIVTFAPNETLKSRTGKITVKGDGYKAVMKFTQYGKDKILSAKRSKKTITLKLKLSSGAKAHYLYVDGEARKVENGITWYGNYETVFSGKIAKASYKFTAKKGYYYWFSIGPAIPYKSGSGTGYMYNTSSYGGMYVENLTGTQNPDYLY